MASTQSGWGVIEWDNASDYSNPQYDGSTGQYTWDKQDSSFDFQLVFNVNTRFGEGEHEMYFAYDNIDFGSTDNRGSIGFQGYRGPQYQRGPLGDRLGQSLAWDNVDEVVKDDYVVCMDYQGPEASYFEVTAWADILPSAVGSTLNFDASADLTGTAQITLGHALKVASHISVLPINDMTTTEETPVSFTVSHIDEQKSANQVIVTGEGFTTEVNGDHVTLTPVKDFSGDTTVTVTVADIEHPTDAASTQFLLTVENTADAPTVTLTEQDVVVMQGETITLDASQSMDPDGDELSFNWSGNGTIADPTAAMTTVSDLSPGEHTFTVTVSDGELESQASMTVNVVTPESRIVIEQIATTSTAEDEAIAIPVHFSNELGHKTVISAMANNATVQVSGHESGSTITFMPAPNFNGDIEVTVMVAYESDPTAVAQTGFTLTVDAVNDAPELSVAQSEIFVREDVPATLTAQATDIDGDNLSYEWTGPGEFTTPTQASTQVSGLAPGQYVFTVNVSDGTETVSEHVQVSVTKAPEVEQPEEEDDSSGSLAWLTLLLAGFAGLRRRKLK